MGEPAKQNFTGPGMKLNSATDGASQIRCEHGKVLVAQNLERGVPVLVPYRCLPGKTGLYGKHVCAAEYFDLHLAAQGAKAVELPGQVGDCEVDIAVAFRVPHARRTSRQHSVAERTHSQPRTPERHPDTRAQNRFQKSGHADQTDLAGLQIKLRSFNFDFGHRVSCRAPGQPEPKAHSYGAGSPSGPRTCIRLLPAGG